MKFTGTILILLFSLLSFGQSIPFPLNNASWIQDIQTESFTIPPVISHSYSYFKTDGDTIIHGTTYTRILNSGQEYCFLRDTSGLIYCRYHQSTLYDTTEFILFNFNLSIGDTLSLPMATNPITYYPAQVYLVDTILINNTMHKRITLSSWVTFEFVEGVGSLQGLTYPEIPWVDYWGDLTCFSRNDTVFQTNGSGQFQLGSCVYAPGYEEYEEQEITAFPNPVQDKLYLDFPKNTPKSIFIYDTEGRMTDHLQTSKNSIDVSGLPPGLYLLTIESEEEKFNFRVVKP